MAKRGNVLAVVGAQYGSEGKGVVVNSIAGEYDVHVRVGGPNAGHSFYHKGQLFKMQVIPCGWTNPNATIVLGRGILIDMKTLMEEIRVVKSVDPSIIDRLVIDERAGILSPKHHAHEGGVDGEIHRRIGSTGEGVGAARVARLNRNPDDFTFYGQAAIESGNADLQRVVRKNTPELINSLMRRGANVLLEGTQGSGLSLIHGPWPYCTSADTNAAQMAADVGIPARYVDRTMLVARTFPIRVAGNSGPLKDELTWDDMSTLVGKPVIERTTVTKKVRRIGRWDDALFMQACVLNAPTSIALMFADYTSPEDEGKEQFHELSHNTRRFIDMVEDLSGAPVAIVGTGGEGWKTVRVPNVEL